MHRRSADSNTRAAVDADEGMEEAEAKEEEEEEEEEEGEEEDAVLWVGALAPAGRSHVPRTLQPRAVTVAAASEHEQPEAEPEEQSAALKAELESMRLASRLLFWAVIALHVVLHPVGFFFVYRPLPGDHSALLAVMYLCGAASLALYVWLARSDPGAIPAFSRYSIRHLYPSNRTCGTCKLVRPLRAKHCKVCGVCVARMDHHCVWLGNCVGASNHLQFVVFLALETVHLGVALVILLKHVWAVRSKYYLLSKGAGTLLALLIQGGPLVVLSKYSQLPLSAFIIVVVLPCWALVASLLIGQTYGASTNVLVNESINRHRYAHLAARNPFHRGFVENWRELWRFATATISDVVERSWKYDECVSLYSAPFPYRV